MIKYPEIGKKYLYTGDAFCSERWIVGEVYTITNVYNRSTQVAITDNEDIKFTVGIGNDVELTLEGVNANPKRKVSFNVEFADYFEEFKEENVFRLTNTEYQILIEAQKIINKIIKTRNS